MHWLRRRKAIDQFAEEIAAPLLQPGGARDMAFARRRILEALESLAQHMCECNFKVIKGRIDLLLEGVDWFAIVDHKSFPGARDSWEEKAIAHAPQLAIYAQGVEAAIGKRCS
jgi:ATP-dependent exoDNAse (exonuclease V) beta subunit